MSSKSVCIFALAQVVDELLKILHEKFIVSTTQVKHLSDAPFQGMLLPYRQTLDQTEKACQGQTLQLIMKLVNYGQKSFISIAPCDIKWLLTYPIQSCKIGSQHRYQKQSHCLSAKASFSRTLPKRKKEIKVLSD